MPLPQFLWTLLVVLLAALATLWGALTLGVPLPLMGLIALGGAAALHLAMPGDNDSHPRPGA